MRYQYRWCSRRYHLWHAVRTARTIGDLEMSRRDQRNQILTLDVSTSSNLAVLGERGPFSQMCVFIKELLYFIQQAGPNRWRTKTKINGIHFQ